MKKEGLVSNYTTAQFKPQKDTCNESRTENILNRQFQGQCYRNVVISNLTYVIVGAKWNYICVLVNLFNREIIGYSAGEHKTAELVKEAFQMKRSLSHKGCPYDNAVAEATFKIIKTEFVWNETFHNLEELNLKLWDYVNWYNCHRIHSSLGYLSPVQYRENNLKKVV